MVSPRKVLDDGTVRYSKSREDWKRETMIAHHVSKNPEQRSCWSHGGKCTPGIQNLVQVASRAGIYAKNVSSRIIFSLCCQASIKRLTVAQIKGALFDLLPKNTTVTRQHVFNMRLKVMRLLPIIKQNSDYENFRLYVNDTNLVHGLDDDIEMDDDVAHKICTELWLAALAGKSSGEEGSVQTLTCYMNLLSSSARGFTYAVATDDNNQATGLVWMTGTMRDNFER